MNIFTLFIHPKDIALLIICVFAIIALLISMRIGFDKETEEWFDEVKRLAYFHGYTKEEISEFEIGHWEDYYLAGLTPEEAIKEKLSEI